MSTDESTRDNGPGQESCTASEIPFHSAEKSLQDLPDICHEVVAHLEDTITGETYFKSKDIEDDITLDRNQIGPALGMLKNVADSPIAVQAWSETRYGKTWRVWPRDVDDASKKQCWHISCQDCDFERTVDEPTQFKTVDERARLVATGHLTSNPEHECDCKPVATDGGVATFDRHTPTPQDLSTFQHEILLILADSSEPRYGLAIKRELQERFGQEVNHGRLYPNLDQLVEQSLVEKGERDRRTNEYGLSADGKELLEADAQRRYETVFGLVDGGEH